MNTEKKGTALVRSFLNLYILIIFDLSLWRKEAGFVVFGNNPLRENLKYVPFPSCRNVKLKHSNRLEALMVFIVVIDLHSDNTWILDYPSKPGLVAGVCGIISHEEWGQLAILTPLLDHIVSSLVSRDRSYKAEIAFRFA